MNSSFLRKKTAVFFTLVIGLASLVGCQKSSNDSIQMSDSSAGLRPLTTSERAQDFDQILELFKEFYGPYLFKENLFNIKIEDLAKNLKDSSATASSDEDFAGHIMQMGAALHDGHVQIKAENSSTNIDRYSVPVFLTPVQGRVLVGDIDKKVSSETHIKIGDEVLAVDGKAPLSYLPTILKYRSNATTLSDQHLIMTLLQRYSYMTDLVPTANTVRLKVQHTSGNIDQIDLPWQTSKYNPGLEKLLPIGAQLKNFSVAIADDLNSAVGENGEATIKQMGDPTPFFLTAQTLARFHFVKVYPSDESRKLVGLKPEEKPPIYAALYKHKGKNVLLVREASYSQHDFKGDVYLRAYMALFYEYQDLADVLVLDQTHNPGGSYCSEFYNLFARNGDVQAVERTRADRKWINDLKVNEVSKNPQSVDTLEAQLAGAWGQTIEKAYDKGAHLAEPIPLFTGSFYAVRTSVTWDKPMLVLIDELAGSCGDIFPMLVKANKRAALFGQTTMGLGGNVEEVGVLTHSRIHVSMTRGMFYPFNENGATDFVENVGVSPDIPYAHTVIDFRSGYLRYVQTFSDRAVEQVP